MPVMEWNGRRAVRLLFEWDGSDVSLRGARPLSYELGPSEDVSANPRGDFWIELRDAHGKVLYRHRERNPLRRAVEAFDGSTVGWRPDRAPSHQRFVLYVPLDDAGETISLFGAPVSETGRRSEPTELGRFSLTDALPRVTAH
jgi:hypothetical protein